MDKFSSETAHSLYFYDAERGCVISKRTGRPIGHATRDGYLRVSIRLQPKTRQKGIAVHRLVWLLVRNEWPDGHIDHINGNKTDNRIENLRLVDRYVNAQNTRHAISRNSTGYLGVSRKNKRRFQARIYHEGKLISLGVFADAHEAHLAYLNAKRRLHPGCTI